MPRHVPRIAILYLLFSLTSSAAHASFAQQGSKLVGTGGSGPNYQGTSVAISADGNTAIVGGPSDNANIGAAWVFTRSVGVWTQQGAKLVGTGFAGTAPQMGTSVALSADGNTALVGANSDNGSVGAAWVFTRSAGVWSQQGTKLVGTGIVGGALYGMSVALSADGNTAMIGAPIDNGSVGAAWVFTRSAGVWSQQGSKLVGSGAAGNAQQGMSVALSADGNTAMIGGPFDNSARGAAWMFTRGAGVWTQQGAKLTGAGVAPNTFIGNAVALSGDGNTASAGGYFDNAGAGAIWMYTRSGEVWTQQGPKLVADGTQGTPRFGYSVSLSSDGNTAVAGGFTDNGNVGALWTFRRGAGVWSQQGAKLVGTGAVGAARQGTSAAISADGKTAITGGSFDASTQGAAWVDVLASPVIVTIRDVPNDQGGKVSLRWSASLLDVVPSNPIDAYWIWRQVPISGAQQALAHGATLLDTGVNILLPAGRVFRTTTVNAQVYYWEFVASQVAHGFPAYSYTASTLSDSIAGSNPYTLFMVETENTSTGQYWSSEPDSGYSVDNLAPMSPAPFLGAYSGGATHLHWGTNSEADLAGYRIYRGNSAGFVPSPGNLATAQPDTGYADAGPAGSYYKLSAVDIHDNESAFVLLSSQGTTAVGDEHPIAFSLQGVRPQPARGNRLVVTFSLPAAATARLELVDLGGRRVRSREVGSLGIGQHVVDLSEGRRVVPGLYWLSLSQGANRAGVRVVVIE